MTPEERLERRRVQARARYAANPEKALAYARAYASSGRKRAWYLKNADKERAKAMHRARARRDTAPDMVRAEQRAWRVANPDKVLAIRRASQAKHADKNRQRSNAWAAQNRERVRARVKAWRISHPEYEQVKKARRRALMLSAPAFEFTSTEWETMKVVAGGCCHYCGQKAHLTIDHKQALSRGGGHVASNIVPACASCNNRKGTKSYETFVESMARIG